MGGAASTGMGVREKEQVARRSLAGMALCACLIGTGILVSAICDTSWSNYSQVDGSGSFGIFHYHFTINNITREGDIQSHKASALCNLDYYNATRAFHADRDGVPGRWKDDCDAMIDACGLAKWLGILAIGTSLAAAVLSLVSALVRDDRSTNGVHFASMRARVCPPHSTSALGCAITSAVSSLLAVLAYAGERPSSPNYFLKDYDTPGANRTWSYGGAFYIMIGGSLIMGAASMFLVAVKNSKRVLLTGREEISTALLESGEDRHWDDAEEQRVHDTAGPDKAPL